MTSKTKLPICLLLVLLATASCGREGDTSREAMYLGQVPPGLEPKVFAPGIVSTDEYFEFSNTLSPDGSEFYFARRKDGKDAIMITRWRDGRWTPPEVAPFYEKYGGFEPHISGDGRRMYITRFGPPPGFSGGDADLSTRDTEAQMVNIWVMERVADEWGEPEYCVNGMYVTTSKNGTIYTTDIRETTTGICKYVVSKGQYAEREHLGGGVNSPSPGAHPCIASDENFVVFDSERSDDPENSDLYVCFRNDDGTWSDALDLGDEINTETSEICAALSPDGKYLFYHSRGDIYWVSTDIIDVIREQGKPK